MIFNFFLTLTLWKTLWQTIEYYCLNYITKVHKFYCIKPKLIFVLNLWSHRKETRMSTSIQVIQIYSTSVSYLLDYYTIFFLSTIGKFSSLKWHTELFDVLLEYLCYSLIINKSPFSWLKKFSSFVESWLIG